MKRVVLLGGGAAHQAMLRGLAAQPLPGAEVALIAGSSPGWCEARLPAWVAGRLPTEQCSVPLQAWAEQAGVHWVEATVAQLDADRRCVRLSDGRLAEYDLLSVDLPAGTDRDRFPGARRHGLFARPLGPFTRLLDGLVAMAQGRSLDVVVVGADRHAVGLALALQHRLGQGGTACRVALVTNGQPLLAGAPPAFVQKARAWLARRRVTLLTEVVTQVDAQAVHLANGARLACDAPVIATPPEPPLGLADSGLALDAAGWPLATDTLQSASHPTALLAPEAGSHPAMAAQLALNLRHLAAGGLLSAATPRPAPPVWLDGGDGAFLVGGRWGTLQARWLRRWHDHVHPLPAGPVGAATPG